MNKEILALKIERFCCTCGVVMCAVLSVLSCMMLEWKAIVASMLTMMVCEVAYQLVTKQINE
jgi:hypothetical protein